MWLRAALPQLPSVADGCWAPATLKRGHGQARPVAARQQPLTFPPTRVKSQQVTTQDAGSSSDSSLGSSTGSAALSAGTSVRPVSSGGSQESR